LSGAKGRFRRSLLGYRVREVEEALAERDAELTKSGIVVAEMRAELSGREQLLSHQERRLAELEGVSRYLSQLVVERERELRELRAPLVDIGAQARGQATRIRMQALKQAVQLVARVGGAQGAGEARAAGSDEAEQPAADERFALGRRAAVDAATEPDVVAVAAEIQEVAEEARVEAAVDPGAVTGETREMPVLGWFEGLVQMEVGPLADFAQLVRFEDAVRGIAGASEISVKRFSRGRATLALRLQQPVALLAELERAVPFPLSVRGLRDDRLIIDVAEAA
jgi:hypothetical protein